MTCAACKGPLPSKPYIWTCWDDGHYDFTDHHFCSGHCRDTWLQRRLLDDTRCHVCNGKVAVDDLTFEYFTEVGKSLPVHKGCVGRG